MRIETVINDPGDFGIGKGLANLPALRQVGFTASRRPLGVQKISHDPAAGAAAITAISASVITGTGTRTAGLRFTDERVQALLSALCVPRQNRPLPAKTGQVSRSAAGVLTNRRMGAVLRTA